MIKKNNKEVGFIEKGTTNIDKIYKGTNLVFEQGFDREDSGSTPLTTSHEAIGKNLLDYKVYGNSIQNGTPLPSNPVEIESVGDKTINLFSGENVTTDKVLSWTSGKESSSGANANDIITPYLLIDGLSYLNSNYNFAVFFYDDNKNYLGNSEDVRQTTGIYYGSDKGAVSISSAISSNPNIKYYRVWYRSSANNNIDFKEITDIMLYNSNALIDNYEPYGYRIPVIVKDNNNVIQSTTNIYLDEPLRKIGDYADYIDFENGKIVRKVKTLTLDGSESYANTSSSNLFFVYINSSSLGYNINYNIGGYCNYFGFVNSSDIISNSSANSILTNNQTAFRLGNTKDRLYIKSTTFEDANDLKNWIQSNDIRVYYVPDNPTEESITLPTIPSIKGTTIYSVGTNIQPSNMYIKYKGR